MAVTQATTHRSLQEPFTKFIAEHAIDGNMTTASRTTCSWDSDHWYKIKFGALYCFSTIVIVNEYTGLRSSYGIDDTNVFVVDTVKDTVYFCGVIKVRNVNTAEGQTYRIPCHGKCGDEVKLTLRHDRDKHNHKACIHMKEIKSFQGKSFLYSVLMNK